MRNWIVACLIALLGLSVAGPGLADEKALSEAEIVRRVSPSLALILVGEGGGRLSKTGSGLIVEADGTLLTAYHLLRDAGEVQVRLHNGDVYDNVTLVGIDERRNIAALRISGQNLPVLATALTETLEPGSTVYAVSNPTTLGWTVSTGRFDGFRQAEEVEHAGEGYRVILFATPIPPAANGSILVDSQGRALGVVTHSRRGQHGHFAVPVSSVLGLAERTALTQLGKGQHLRLPTVKRSPRASEAVEANPMTIVRQSRTVMVVSRDHFFPEDPLEHQLQKDPDFRKWGFVMVTDRRAADLIIEVDRPVFTWDFTYSIVHPRTSVSLGSGKVIAWDGVRAARPLARKIIESLRRMRATELEEVQASNSKNGRSEP